MCYTEYLGEISHHSKYGALRTNYLFDVPYLSSQYTRHGILKMEGLAFIFVMIKMSSEEFFQYTGIPRSKEVLEV